MRLEHAPDTTDGAERSNDDGSRTVDLAAATNPRLDAHEERSGLRIQLLLERVGGDPVEGIDDCVVLQPDSAHSAEDVQQPDADMFADFELGHPNGDGRPNVCRRRDVVAELDEKPILASQRRE
jgi:hypothetical protein